MIFIFYKKIISIKIAGLFQMCIARFAGNNPASRMMLPDQDAIHLILK
jgi:uncharacterized membrane protein